MFRIRALMVRFLLEVPEGRVLETYMFGSKLLIAGISVLLCSGIATAQEQFFFKQYPAPTTYEQPTVEAAITEGTITEEATEESATDFESIIMSYIEQEVETVESTDQPQGFGIDPFVQICRQCCGAGGYNFFIKNDSGCFCSKAVSCKIGDATEIGPIDGRCTVKKQGNKGCGI